MLLPLVAGAGWGTATASWTAIAALLIAMAIDLVFGEPAARWHPVVWVGRGLGWAGQRIAPDADAGTAPEGRDLPRFAAGAAYWCVGAVAVLGVAGLWQYAAAQLPPVFAACLLGLALKPMLAWRMLRDEVLAVEAALGTSLAAGRSQLGRLVSRDVAQLDAAAVRESAIESLAENLNDSVVAPIFWFVLLGLPGAALYRFANTADAMWGYRGVRQGRVWEWAGKWAAHADDVLSWLPARITGVLIGLAAGRGMRWAALRAEAGRTPSPNSGWPMAAMALALGIRLSKKDVYTLNGTGRAPVQADVQRAAGLCRQALLAHLLLAISTMVLTILMET
ncbi:MAG: cobalamin biosynthesis protein CobD [Rhodoferax sp.]|nr:cobalamin biosynthesis protein CobD [Rhodoferax sp.]